MSAAFEQKLPRTNGAPWIARADVTVMIPDDGPDHVRGLADRVLSSIETPISLDGGEFFLTGSVGIASGVHPTDAYALVRKAEAAMYAARADGPGRRRVRPVVRAIADLARAYGLQVVAEGIETAQALEAVDALGCEYGQGVHLGRPAAASVIEAKLGAPLPSDIGLSPVPMSSRPPV